MPSSQATAPASSPPSVPPSTQVPISDTLHQVDNLTAVPHFERCLIEDRDGWRKVSSHQSYADDYIQIEKAHYLTPTHQDHPIPWTIAHRKSAIAVAPIDRDGNFIMVQQERLPVQQTLWEFPAGQIDHTDERRLDSDVILGTVAAELREEAGYRLADNASLIPLGYFFSSQGFTTEHVYLFAADPVEPLPSGNCPVGGERIHHVRAFPPAEFRRMVAENGTKDALSLALFARMAARNMI